MTKKLDILSIAKKKLRILKT